MKIEEIKSEFKLRAFGAKGWLRSKSLPCPFCGKDDKFGIILNQGGKCSYNCFHGSCGEKGSLQKLFKKINRLDLISSEETVKYETKLNGNLINNVDEENLKTLIVKPPLGFKRIYEDEYLRDRGFTEEQFDIFNVGICIDPSFKKHLIFLILENNECVGYLGRTKLSKEWHKMNLEKSKLGEEPFLARYKNASLVDFDKILGGYDELNNDTETIIIVEGLMDKQNVDIQLNLYKNDKMKCIFTFGNSISEIQISKLKRKKNLRNIYLMYDFGTIKQSSQFGLLLSKSFNTLICNIATVDKDPGDMNYSELKNLLDDATKPMHFKLNKLPESSLK